MVAIIKKKLFVKGLKLPENKISANKPIEKLSIPGKILILLQQHFGEPCNPVVARGDKVKTGQIIADSDKLFSAPIHSSITGTITSMTKVINPFANNIVDAIEITADEDKNMDEWVELESDKLMLELSENLKKLYFENSSSNFSDQKIRVSEEQIKFSEEQIRLKETQPQNLWKELIKLINEKPKEEIIQRVRDAGIVGLGGATFPTHVKLSTKKVIDTLIINGCECEPFITSDHRIMLEYGWQVLLGAYIIFKVLSPKTTFIAIEDNKEDAIKLFSQLIEDAGLENTFKIISLKSRYPMGAEKTLIKNVLGRKVPVGGLPMDIGVVVNNVGTAKAVFEAVSEGKPLIEKIVTVTGDIKNPANLLVRLGTPVKDLINTCNDCEKYDIGDFKVILGGPMMGNVIADLNFPITKAVNCILVKKVKRDMEGNCIRCGRCITNCPMNLMPLMYAVYTKNSKFEVLEEYYINTCIECGSCAYVCPSSIPIVAYIKTAKSVLSGYGK